MDREALTHLRSLVYRGDAAGLVAALSKEWWPASLQLIGDGLRAAVAGAVDGSTDLALTCVEALRERRWEGDRELAESIEAALGNGPTPMLRPLPVDLEELAMILEGDPVHGGGRIDLVTGEVWPQSAWSTPRRSARSLRKGTTIPTGGCGWTAKDRGAATTTWSGSSTTSTTPASPIG